MTRYEVRCNRCDLAGAGPRDVVCSYVVGENRLTVDRRLAWCHQCQDVVYGEAIQDLAQLEADLQTAVDQLDSLADDEQTQWLNAYLPDYIEQMRQRVEWRRTRQSPPRCLTCGSTALTFARACDGPDREDDFWELTHPDCGGVIRIDRTGPSSDRLWLRYTPEGDLMSSNQLFASQRFIRLDHD